MITASQIRAARELLGWSVMTLSKRSKRGLAVIEAAERGVASLNTLLVLQQVLEAAGVIFVAENGDGPGVQLRKG